MVLDELFNRSDDGKEEISHVKKLMLFSGWDFGMALSKTIVRDQEMTAAVNRKFVANFAGDLLLPIELKNCGRAGRSLT